MTGTENNEIAIFVRMHVKVNNFKSVFFYRKMCEHIVRTLVSIKMCIKIEKLSEPHMIPSKSKKNSPSTCRINGICALFARQTRAR